MTTPSQEALRAAIRLNIATFRFQSDKEHIREVAAIIDAEFAGLWAEHEKRGTIMAAAAFHLRREWNANVVADSLSKHYRTKFIRPEPPDDAAIERDSATGAKP